MYCVVLNPICVFIQQYQHCCVYCLYHPIDGNLKFLGWTFNRLSVTQTLTLSIIVWKTKNRLVKMMLMCGISGCFHSKRNCRVNRGGVASLYSSADLVNLLLPRSRSLFTVDLIHNWVDLYLCPPLVSYL